MDRVYGSDQNITPNMPSPSGMPVGPLALPGNRFRSLRDGNIADVFDESRFARLNGELVVPVGVTSLLVLQGPRQLRNFLGFRNSSLTALNIFIAFGNVATTFSWLRLEQNTIALFDTVVPQDDVYAICSGAAGTLTIVQSTTPGGTI